jgi:hypothetical protein
MRVRVLNPRGGLPMGEVIEVSHGQGKAWIKEGAVVPADEPAPAPAAAPEPAPEEDEQDRPIRDQVEGMPPLAWDAPES